MLKSTKGVSLAAAVFALLTSAPAAAADCPPLTRLASLDLEPSLDRREAYVPVAIEGVRKLMLLDTGGAMTEITPEAADEVKLHPRRGTFRLYDVYGKYTDQFTMGALALGPLVANNVALVVANSRKLFGDDTGIAGILAPDVLKHYDVDIDFGADKLNLISPNHCDGRVVYWPAATVAVVPMRVLHSGHIVIPVLLDGKPVTAMLDTGAYHTTLLQPLAQSEFGLKLGAADSPQVGHFPGMPNAITYRHVFSSLAFDGITVNNLQVDIIPDLLEQVLASASAPATGSRIRDPKKLEADVSMLIGMNILRHFHLYIAYKEEKLYVSPVDAPPPPTAEAPPSVNYHLRAEDERRRREGPETLHEAGQEPVRLERPPPDRTGAVGRRTDGPG